MSAATTCTHCGLPLGCLAQQREVNGEHCDFCCYGCCLAYQVQHGVNDEPAAATWLIRLGVGGFLAMNIMLFSLLLYADAFAISPTVAQLIPWLLWALATPLLLMLGGPFFSGAWQALREGRMGSDTLVVVATTAAYGYSVWHVVHAAPQYLYFDTVTMVLLLFTFGRYLEAQARARTAHQLAPLLAAERAQVHLVTDALETLRPVSEVKPGDLVRVLPGECIAVDGEVVEGVSSCDETILTGQSQPQRKQPGSHVHAGSINGNAMLLLRITSTDTRWMQISRQVRNALAHKSGMAQMVERIAAGFVPLVLLLAMGTFWFWSIVHDDFNRAMLYGMAVLVVACPCSLGLAAPLAATLGLGRAAQHGIVIRGGAVLERLASVRGIAFDKTGTLTADTLQPLALTVVDATEIEAVARAKALAQTSTHPLSRAITAMAGKTPATARAVVATPGAGIEGVHEGAVCALGSARFMESLGWNMPAALHTEHCATTGVYVGWAGQVHARIDFTAMQRPKMAQVIGAVKAHGLRTLVLSGDGVAEVSRTASALGIEVWHGELSPETKVSTLRHWQARYGPLAMVGDEINDGPVLAAAHVGIAVGNASDFARESADVTLPHIEKLPWLLELARQVRRSTYANLAWAFGYNGIALGLAASGYLQPIYAAALMAGSSLLVVSRSVRAHGWAARKDAAATSLAESE